MNSGESMVRNIGITLMLLLLLSACGGNGNTLTTEGSTSAEKVMGFLSEGYEKEAGTRVNFNPTGSSAGIESVKEGRCDIGVISRELTSEEKTALESVPIAIDTIVVVTNIENGLNELTLAEISRIFSGEVTDWSRFGADSRPIVIIGREAGSGTRDAFETATGLKGQCKYKQELTSAGDVITAVKSNKNAIGYTSLESVRDNVKVLNIDGVSPTEENIKSGKYILQRQFLFVTVKGQILSGKKKEFYDFVVSGNGSKYIRLAGWIPIKA